MDSGDEDDERMGVDPVDSDDPPEPSTSGRKTRAETFAEASEERQKFLAKLALANAVQLGGLSGAVLDNLLSLVRMPGFVDALEDMRDARALRGWSERFCGAEDEWSFKEHRLDVCGTDLRPTVHCFDAVAMLKDLIFRKASLSRGWVWEPTPMLNTADGAERVERPTASPVFREMSQQVPGTRLGALVVYADAARTVKRGNTTMHPVIATLANQSFTDYRQSYEDMCIGYIEDVSQPPDITDRAVWGRVKSDIYAASIDLILGPLKEASHTAVSTTDADGVTFPTRFDLFLCACDLPELQALAGVNKNG
jgi:hypothetical protein